jgi:hypothetical protein
MNEHSQWKGFNFSLTKTMTLFKFLYDIDGVSGVASYPGINVANDHIKARGDSDSSAVFIENTDEELSIVIHNVAINKTIQVSSDRPPLMGTLAAAGSGGDILRYGVTLNGNNASFKGPFVLPRGTALMHYMLKGPMGNPAVTNINYSVIVNYNLTDAPPTVELVPETAESEGEGEGGDGGGGR